MKKALLITLCVIVGLLLVFVIAYNVMMYTGEKSLRKKGAPPNLPSVEDSLEETPSNPSQEIEEPDSEPYSVKYNGKKYRY